MLLGGAGGLTRNGTSPPRLDSCRQSSALTALSPSSRGPDISTRYLLMTFAPAVPPFSAPGVNVMRFEHSKAAEFWSFTADQYAVDEFWG